MSIENLAVARQFTSGEFVLPHYADIPSIDPTLLGVDPTMRGTRAGDTLFLNEARFDFYQKFRSTFVGDARVGATPPIIRNRGEKQVVYDREMYSGMSEDGTHLVHVRRGSSTDKSTLPQGAQFFVVTGDFESYDETEWWVYKYEASSVHHKTSETLFLSDQPVHEMDDPKTAYASAPPFLRRMLEGAEKQTQAEIDCTAFTFSLIEGSPRLYWGDGKPAKHFKSIAEIDNELAAWQLALEKPELTYLPTPHDSFRVMYPTLAKSLLGIYR